MSASSAIPFIITQRSDMARCNITLPSTVAGDVQMTISGMTGHVSEDGFTPGGDPAFIDMAGKTATLDTYPWGLLCRETETSERVIHPNPAAESDHPPERIGSANIALCCPLSLYLAFDGSEDNQTEHSRGEPNTRDAILCITPSFEEVQEDEGNEEDMKSGEIQENEYFAQTIQRVCKEATGLYEEDGEDEESGENQAVYALELDEACGTAARSIDRFSSAAAVHFIAPIGVGTEHPFYPIVERIEESTGRDLQHACELYRYRGRDKPILLFSPRHSRYRLDDGRTMLLGGKVGQGTDGSTTYDALIIRDYLSRNRETADCQRD